MGVPEMLGASKEAFCDQFLKEITQKCLGRVLSPYFSFLAKADFQNYLFPLADSVGLLYSIR